ncbi:hypothetical protein KCP74_24705 [Salmonella enterica subsp. enterica]|nr:hypothetical protein KCP74_24705 [Salmonella enterica subsp. enterica]
MPLVLAADRLARASRLRVLSARFAWLRVWTWRITKIVRQWRAICDYQDIPLAAEVLEKGAAYS